MMASNGSPGDVEASINAKEKRRILQEKIKKIKLKQSKGPYWARPKKYKNQDVQLIVEAHYKKRLAKYKETNTQLAHVVADQKQEVAHWYNDALTLKSEVQSLEEKLLRYTNLQTDELINIEVERRIQERCESLNQAVNGSMSSFMEAVEGISKVKELVCGLARSSSSRGRSMSVASSSSLPPQEDGEKNSSESNSYERSNNDQPEEENSSGSQPTPKLTRIWRQRQQDRVQANEDQVPDMSVIGEQSTIMDDTVADALLNSALSEVSELSETMEEDQLDTFESSATIINENIESDVDVDSENEDIELPHKSNNIDDVKKRMSSVPIIFEETIPGINDETLEGPSLHPKSKMSRRSSFRGARRVSWAPIEDRGAVIESRGSKMRKSSILHLQLDLSSDFEENNSDELPVINKPERKILGENVSLSESILASPKASPATMLSRFEAMENKDGRKKRSRSRGYLAVFDDPMNTVNEKSSTKSCVIRLPEEKCYTDNLLMPPPAICITPAQEVKASAPNSFLIGDNDLTVVENLDMSMSDSVPNIIMVNQDNIIYDNSYEDNTYGKGVKKFFPRPLAQETSINKEMHTTLNKNTPYDLSLLEETGVSIIPFSSTKDYKENCPPKKDNRKSEKVRRCSIVLNDIIASPRVNDILSPNLVFSPGGTFSLVSPVEKLQQSPKLDKKKYICKSDDIENKAISEDDVKEKSKENESSTKHFSKSRPSLSLKSRTKSSEEKAEKEVMPTTSGRIRNKDLNYKLDLESSIDISFSEGDESWCKTPIKKTKSIGKSRLSKSVGSSRKSLMKIKSAEVSENTQSIVRQNTKKDRSSRSKKSKLNKDTLNDNVLITEPGQGESPECEPTNMQMERQSQKKRSSHSKKFKLNEDTSVGQSVNTELQDNVLFTATDLGVPPELESNSMNVERQNQKKGKGRPKKSKLNTDSSVDDLVNPEGTDISPEQRKSPELEFTAKNVKRRSSRKLSLELAVLPSKIKASNAILTVKNGDQPNRVSDEELVDMNCTDDGDSHHQDDSKTPLVGAKREVVGHEEEDEIPRKRRTATKITSYKEPNRMEKMRGPGPSKPKNSKSKIERYSN